MALDDLESFTVEPPRTVFSVWRHSGKIIRLENKLFSSKFGIFYKAADAYCVLWYCPDQPSDHSFVMKASKHQWTHTKLIWFGLRWEVCVFASSRFSFFMSGRECDVWTVGGSALPSVSKVPSCLKNGTRWVFDLKDNPAVEAAFIIYNIPRVF